MYMEVENAHIIDYFSVNWLVNLPANFYINKKNDKRMMII